MNNYKFLNLLVLVLFLIGCEKSYTPEEIEYVKSIEEKRVEKNTYMKDDPKSPFNFKGKVEFHDLNYFDVDPNFVFKSQLVEYDIKEDIQIFGTKGEERTATRFGYLTFTKHQKEYKINVYSSIASDSSIYHSIWFTDKTTNNETYGVGRYLPFDLNQDKNYKYTIDFNLAYNPYCAYSSDYSCAIPSKEDYIDLAIKAGELKYHD